MKHLLIPSLCCLMLAACQQGVHKSAPGQEPIEITGEATSDVVYEPIISNDPSVTVYSLEGPIENPMNVDRTHSVLDNTTAGGYTVFDSSVKIFPLPGEAAPAYMPQYAVPPMVGSTVPEAPRMGAPVSLSSAGMLPPVPTVDIQSADPYAKPPVSGAMRQPLTLTAVAPTTMQAPASARAPMLSPFGDTPQNENEMPVTPTETVATPAPAPVVEGTMTAGRRSSPMLTGY